MQSKIVIDVPATGKSGGTDSAASGMSVLRALADQPASEFNRVPLGERHIDQYLQAKGASLELLTTAINAEGDDDFWIMMLEYVQSRWGG